jgi:hypothetical protein
VPAQPFRPTLIIGSVADTLDRGPRRADAARFAAGPAIAGAIGALGFSVLIGASGVVFALALCAAVPAAALAWRRRSASH